MLAFEFSKPIHINANEEIAAAGNKSMQLRQLYRYNTYEIKKSISNICVVVVLLFITGWVG